MSRYQVVVAPRAWAQLDALCAWWAENRRDATYTPDSEVADVLDHLAELPESGERYDRSRLTEVRRLLMPRIPATAA